MTQVETWTTRSLLSWMTQLFEDNDIDSPKLLSEMLLAHVLGGQRIDLYANVNQLISEEGRDTLRAYVKRALEYEPVQYIVGKAMFFGKEFEVDSSTLIPRTCTERIVQQAVHYCNTNPNLSPKRIADIGTGSGCIAITIAANFSNCSVVATDISEEALDVARQNAKRFGVEEQLTFLQGDGTSPLTTHAPFDIICSNPPYIPECELENLAPNVVEWEPHLALEGGEDGIQIVRPLIESAPDLLVQGGILLVEIATSTNAAVLQIAEATSTLGDAVILRDQFGDDRFLRAIKV